MFGDNGKSIEELITHELGHIIDGNYTNIDNGCAHHITMLRSRKDNTCPSRYGGKGDEKHKGDDESEFFAECTAKYIKYGPESLTKEQRQMVEERFTYSAYSYSV